MPQSDPSPADQHQQIPPVDMGDEFNSSLKGLRNLVERITPWLFAVGSWIFAGLIAFNLVIIASLITVGAVDTALLISTAAFACALPLNLAGIFLLRLIKDMEDIGIEDLTLQAFRDAGHPNIEAYFPASHEKASQHRRRSNVVLGYAWGIATLSITLTFAGLVAALWHIAWWISVVLFVVVIVSAVLVIVVVAQSLPPESETEKEMKRRYVEYRMRQGKEQHKPEQGQ